MMSSVRPLLFAPLLAILALGPGAGTGCGRSRPTSPSPPGPALGAEFVLHAGETTTIAGEVLRLTFDAVPADSRCPEDVTCFWEGDAMVALSASLPGAATRALELHTAAGTRGGAREVVYEGFTVALVDLAPRPRTDRRIEPKDYAATLVVRRS